jgi:hypothetical protein
MDAGLGHLPWVLLCKTQSPKVAWMPFLERQKPQAFARARDRSGNTGSPAGAEELERIARSGPKGRLRPYGDAVQPLSHSTGPKGLMRPKDADSRAFILLFFFFLYNFWMFCIMFLYGKRFDPPAYYQGAGRQMRELPPLHCGMSRQDVQRRFR